MSITQTEITADVEASTVAILDKTDVYDQLKVGMPGLDFAFGRKKLISVGGMPRKTLRTTRGGAERTRDLTPLSVTRHQILGVAMAPYWAKSNSCAVISDDEVSDAGGSSPYVVRDLAKSRLFDTLDSTKYLWAGDFHTGTAAGTSNMGLIGLADLFDNTLTSYMGIDGSGAGHFWRAYTATGSLGADYFKYIRDTQTAIRERGEELDIGFVNSQEFAVMQDLLAPVEQRWVTQKDFKDAYGTKTGAQGLMAGPAVIWHDPFATAAKIRLLVSGDLEFQVKSDMDMKRYPWTSLMPYYHGIASNIILRAQLIPSRRQVHAQITLS